MLVKSNQRTSRDLLVRVWLTEEAANYVDAVAGWVSRAVSLAHPPGPHPSVAGTLYNNFHKDGDTYNCVEVAVHNESTRGRVQSSQYDDDKLIVVRELGTSVDNLSADAVCQHLPETKLPIVAVGVSAVSEAFCSELWDEIVDPVRTWMDGSGGGKGEHLQYMYTTEYGLWTVGEGSHLFYHTSIPRSR